MATKPTSRAAGACQDSGVRVLLTGGTGFVGSYAAPEVLAAGHDLRLLVRSAAKARHVLARRGVDVAEVELVEGDMVDAGSVATALEGCEAAIHAAAAVAVTGADNERVVSVNVDGTRNVVGQGVQRGLDPVIHLSTTAVFVPPPGPVITTDSPLAAPHNAYGRSKVEAERFVRDLQDQGAPVTVVYPGGVLGPDQPTLDAAVEGVAGALEKAWPMTGGGVTIIDVRDLARIISAAVDPGRGPRRFMAGGRYLSWPRFADLCDELTGTSCRRLVMPGPALIALGRVLDAAKRVRAFEYPLTADAAEFMAKMVPTEDGPTIDALGVEYRPTAETVEDTLRWLAAEGHLSARAAGRLAPATAQA